MDFGCKYSFSLGVVNSDGSTGTQITDYPSPFSNCTQYEAAKYLAIVAGGFCFFAAIALIATLLGKVTPKLSGALALVACCAGISSVGLLIDIHLNDSTFNSGSSPDLDTSFILLCVATGLIMILGGWLLITNAYEKYTVQPDEQRREGGETETTTINVRERRTRWTYN